ncbi:MAG: 4Fe-4S binding protein [Chloroflexi bacterium]|nr:4Fe-4S binding protein [Chloroflexota bacterium]
MAISEQELELEGLKAGLKKEARRVKLNFDELKSGGFIKQVQKDLFTVRLRCPGGKVTADRLKVAAEIAEKFGRGEVHLSVRQSVEVPYVSYEHFDAVTAALKEVNWSVASCGPRVRVPTACAGCTYNPNGLVDTQSICAEVDRRYFGTPTGHHKFKISFSGCPIDCFRTREMDLGFQGTVEPKLDEELCSGCELCVRNCEDRALRMENGLPVRDWEKCVGCGDCLKVCPVDAMVTARRGWLARVGGKHGKHPYFAYEVANFLSDEQAHSLMEKTLEWYQKNGEGRERIGVTIGRLGLGRYVDEVVRPLGLEAIEKPEERRKFRAEGNFYE